MAKREISKIDHHLERYRGISNIVIAKGNMLTNIIGSDTHSGEAGASRENVLADIIKAVLPSNVEVVTGFIIDSKAMPITDFLDGKEPV